MITRFIEKDLRDALHRHKTILLYGPRQAGKTTLVKKILADFDGIKEYVSSDYLSQSERIASRDHIIYRNKIGDKKLIIIDEAQRIPDIGLCLKIMHDEFPTCQIIATGSSSFELAQHTQEPLTGRKVVFSLFPLSIYELFTSYQRSTFNNELESMLLYGLYPAIYSTSSITDKQQSLQELVDAYLFKDILLFEGIKKSDSIVKLAKLLAFQIGKPVSMNELADKLQINARTVERYITILEQAFIIFKLGSYSKNLRKEVSKGQKYYFWDLGIRNGLINAFQDIDMRADKGEIRENFVVAEIMKHKMHTKQLGTYYFWRTYDDQEIDLLYENNGILTGYEIKWKDRIYKTPKAFSEAYPDSVVQLVSQENILNWVQFTI